MKLASEVVATESIKTKLYIADGMSQAGQINCFSVLSFFLANYLAFILIFFKDLFGIYFGILCCSPCGIYFDIFF